MQVLEQFAVDFIARGLDDVRRQTDAATGAAGRAAAAYKKMRDEIQSVGSASNSIRPVTSGGGGFSNVQFNTPSMRTGAGLNLSQPATRGMPTGGGLDAAGLTRLASSAGTASAAIGGLTAYLTTLAAVTKQGFEGTVEIDQFSRAMGQFSRELANVAAPALRLVTDVINGVTAGIRSLGEMGQKVVSRGLFGPIGYLFDVLSDPGIQSAMSQVSAAFAKLGAAAQPLLTILTNVQTFLLKTLVVQPLIDFAEKLTFALRVMENVTRGIGLFATTALRLAGLGGLTRPLAGDRREVRLNQTGTEDAQGTFQRIQQAVLRAGQVDTPEKDPVVERLDQIKGKVEEFYRTVYDAISLLSPAFRLMVPPPSVEGGKAGG